MWSLLLTLASIAVSIGAQDLIDKINRDKANVKNMSADDIMRTVNQVLDRANNYEGKRSGQLNRQLSTLSSKLSALPYNQGVGVVKDKIQEARRNLNNQISKTQDSITTLATEENKAQQNKYDIQTRAQSLATASDSYKNSKSGKDDLAQLQRDASAYVDKIKQINQGVEKYV